MAKKIPTKIIISVNHKKDIGKDQLTEKQIKIKYISKKLITSPTATNVYESKVLLAIWQKNPIAILIEDKNVADLFKSQFNIVWKLAKEK